VELLPVGERALHRLSHGTDVEQRAEEDDLDEDLGVGAGLSGVPVQRRSSDGAVDS